MKWSNLISTNFDFSDERIAEVGRNIEKILEKYGAFWGVDEFIVNPDGEIHIQVQFYGDIELSPTRNKGVWVRFGIPLPEYFEKKVQEIINEVEEVIKDLFDEYEGVWEVKKTKLIPLL